MKYPCIESTIDFTIGPYNLRLWLNEKELPENIEFAKLTEIKNKLLLIVNDPKNNSHKKLLEAVIAAVPDLNAVQLRSANTGMVVYTVDFSGDAHG